MRKSPPQNLKFDFDLNLNVGNGNLESIPKTKKSSLQNLKFVLDFDFLIRKLILKVLAIVVGTITGYCNIGNHLNTTFLIGLKSNVKWTNHL